ncbi:MAG TPA: cell envelope integrity protein CreD [Cyclobacteriaceae bacterium]|jgi:inner membrane protein
MDTSETFIDKLSNWIKNSVILKMTTIAIMVLLLLIPTSMIESVISEREQLRAQATNEVSSKWAGSQQIMGPILTIPLTYEYVQDEKLVSLVKLWYLLPMELRIKGELNPRKLRRGIYEVVVYESNLVISGSFDKIQMPNQTNLKEIAYDQAFLTIGISDLKGIKKPINIKLNEKTLTVEPGSRISDLVYSGVTVDFPDIENLFKQNADFQFSLDLQGSKDLSFIPIGSTTEVEIASSWESPSFSGNFLPDSREVTTDGFKASWLILQLNRNFPQSWIGDDLSKKMEAASFGVDLILPLDDYQKSMRSVKYAIMTITLTFLIFFLVEILNKRKIHPFQYTLVGLALCLFYVLLVSISEHSNFNFAYGISTLGIVSMVALYSLSIFKRRKLTVILVTTLTGIYGFLFVTLQLSEYALLMGSLGLALILGATMYFTRNINWYKLNIETE